MIFYFSPLYFSPLYFCRKVSYYFVVVISVLCWLCCVECDCNSRSNWNATSYLGMCTR
jgi:hypothetical protein